MQFVLFIYVWRVMMPSTSRSNRRKSKSKFVQKPKQQWRVKEQKKNWLELPSDIIFNILNRVGVYDILENAQKVCTIWRKICKDPAMWRVIYMDNHSDPCARPGLQLMCKQAVDRSQGQLVDLTLIDFATHELLLYISERSSQLKRLDISYCFGEFYDGWTEVLKKFPLLEEFSLSTTEISKEDLEGAGYSCPMLTTLKINQKFYKYSLGDNEEESLRIQNENAIAIGKNFPNLIHLEIIGNTMSNIGLQATLEGCNNLESLDLRQCLNVDLEGDIVKKGLERIKCLKLPNDSLEGLPFSLRCHVDLEPEDLHDFEDDFEDDLYDIISHDAYDEYLEYDDYTNPYLFDYIHNVKPDLGLSDSDEEVEELNNMLAFMAFFG